MGALTREIEHNVGAGWGIANSMMRSGSAAAGNIIVAVIILTWLHFKALQLVIKQLRAHPDNKPLWVAVATCIFFVLLFSVPSNERPTFAVLAELSFWIMVAVSWIVKMYYDHLLQREWNRGVLVDEVLHKSWL